MKADPTSVDPTTQPPPDGDFTDANATIHYALCDRKYDVIAMISTAGNLAERVRYSAYGVARHHPNGDITGDGVVDATDLTSLLSNWNQTLGAPGSTYRAEIDFNRGGTVSAADQSTLLSNWGAAQPEGVLSTLGNTVGYSGYLYDQATNMSLARFRWYDATAGRWMTRDPLVSITKSMIVPSPRAERPATHPAPDSKLTDRNQLWRYWLNVTGVLGMRNRYEYVNARPLIYIDDSGLAPLFGPEGLFGPKGPLFKPTIPPHFTDNGIRIPGGLTNSNKYFRFGRGWIGPKHTGLPKPIEIWRFAGDVPGKWHLDKYGRLARYARGAGPYALGACAAAGGYIVGDQIAKHTQIDEHIGDGLAHLCPGCWGWVPKWKIFN